jgi:hypothetical protein
MNVISLQLRLESSSSAARFRVCRVFQARRDVSDLECLRIFSVLATESPPTRGWGLPKFHSQVLISYTWLPLRDPWLAPSVKTGQHQCLPNEEKQVDIFRITVVATLDCIDETQTSQSTSKEDAVWVGNS